MHDIDLTVFKVTSGGYRYYNIGQIIKILCSVLFEFCGHSTLKSFHFFCEIVTIYVPM